MNKMDDTERRKNLIHIRVTDEELKIIDRKVKNSGCGSRCEFIRQMIFQGQLIYINDEVLKDLRNKLNSVSNNVNQIAVRLHKKGNIYDEDIADIKNGVNEIWQLQKSFLSLLQKVKPLPISPTLQKQKTER